MLFDAGNTLLDLDCAFLADLCSKLGLAVRPAEVGAAAAGHLRRHSNLYGSPPAAGDTSDLLLGSFRAIGEALGLGAAAAADFACAARREDMRDPRGLWRCPVPAARATLAALARRGLSLAVVSNSDGQAQRHLELAGLRHFFAVVIDSAEVGLRKPDPGIFHLALAALHQPPANALYVGDLPDIDMAGARSAGMRALLYDPWDTYADTAEARLRSLAGLTRLI